jgi:cell division septal protein FtsQ
MSLSYADFLKTDTVKAIELYGQRTMSPERVARITDDFWGQSLSDLNMDQVQQNFLDYPLIRSAKACRRYPHTLEIYLYDVLPVAYIALNEIMTLDARATLLPLPDNGMLYKLPIVTGIRPTVEKPEAGGQFPDETVKMLINFLTHLRRDYQNIYLDISEISYDRRGIILISATHGTTIYLGNEDEALLHTRILEKFISEESDSGIITPYQYIDLRFARQIIVKERTTR